MSGRFREEYGKRFAKMNEKKTRQLYGPTDIDRCKEDNTKSFYPVQTVGYWIWLVVGRQRRTLRCYLARQCCARRRRPGLI